MKKISILFSLLVAFALASCDQDVEGAINDGTREDVKGVSFSTNVLNDVVITTANPNVTVDLFRSTKSGEQTGQVALQVLTKDADDEYTVELPGCTASDYVFADGSSKTTVTIYMNFDALGFGQEFLILLAIPEDVASKVNETVTEIEGYKDYDWKVLGEGAFVDNFIGFGGNVAAVEIQKAEGFERYRAVKPYTESLENDWGGNTTWVSVPNAPDYVTFYQADSENDVWTFVPFKTGLVYGGSASQPIWAYPANYFGYPLTSNKWLDDKTFQIAPFYYIPAVGGGWNYSQTNGVIMIALP